MTINERARYIWDYVGKNISAGDENIYFIAAQIREAVEEEKQKEVAETVIEMTTGIARIMSETMAKEYLKVKAEAYEDAAKIADELCTNYISDKIRARAKKMK